MDNINREWLNEVDEIATAYENGQRGILDFTNDQLQYLIYWNFGYSGCMESQHSINARAELQARGLAYDQSRAECIELLAEKHY